MNWYPIIQRVKQWLVSLGPRNPLVKLALSFYGRLKGYRIVYQGDLIKIAKNHQAALLRLDHFLFVPMVVPEFDHYFKTIAPDSVGNEAILDFSKPGYHRYLHLGLELICPAIPEDDSMDAYLYKFKLAEGTTVFDLGANAGLTTCMFSLAVGATGKVYAFEPDDINRKCLVENVEELGLKNVTVLDWAIGDHTGEVAFHMDGTTAAGLADLALYPETATTKSVKMFTLRDCCKELGCAPDFVKMDIEGAEIGVVQAACEFLKEVPVHFSIESNHRMKDGTLTYHGLEKMFQSIGYEVLSSEKFGQMFTWATPVVRESKGVS
jgi:FkbM family methyltransferase